MNERKLTEKEIKKLKNNNYSQLARLNRKKRAQNLVEENRVLKTQFDSLVKMLN